MNDEQALNDFFENWCKRYNVVATVEGGLYFQDATQAWERTKYDHAMVYRRMISTEQSLHAATSDAKFFQAKAQEWMTAYQKNRIKNFGDYTRYFIRRPRLRRIILFLMRFG